MDRNKLAVIHIVKKELGLADEEYRDILEKYAGVRSAKDLDENGFRKLMHYFVRSRHYRSGRDDITLRQKMYIKHLVAEAGWQEDHFANFMKKYYRKPTLASFSRKEASKLIESLKNIIKHQNGRE
jgi:protein-disulfide isomerase-like protein with CxxC motif